VDACSCYDEVVILYALADLFVLKYSVHYDGEAKNEKNDPHEVNLPSPLLCVDISEFWVLQL
jgi:hypothetical protein